MSRKLLASLAPARAEIDAGVVAKAEHQLLFSKHSSLGFLLISSIYEPPQAVAPAPFYLTLSYQSSLN